MDAGARRKRARNDTHGFQDVWRGLSVAVSGGLVAFVGLAATDSFNAALNELWIVLLTILGAFVVRPVIEFGWNYAWTPWRVLCEQVEGLSLRPAAVVAPSTPESQGQAKAGGDAQQQFKALHARLRVLRAIEGELRPIRRAAAKAIESGRGSGFNYKNSWDMWSDTVGSVPDWKDLFETLRDSYEGLSELALGLVPSYRSVPDDDRERLEAAIPLLDSALNALSAEIDRLSGLAPR